jgi:hypothetical protein
VELKRVLRVLLDKMDVLLIRSGGEELDNAISTAADSLPGHSPNTFVELYRREEAAWRLSSTGIIRYFINFRTNYDELYRWHVFSRYPTFSREDAADKGNSDPVEQYTGVNYRIFINLFIIFEHWARHCYENPDADIELWNPKPEDYIFDVVATPPTSYTELRPWMFTVTQALRDWMADITWMFDSVDAGVQTDDGVMTRPENNDAWVIGDVPHQLEYELAQIKVLFDSEEGSVHDLNPIIAAQDSKIYKSLFYSLDERGKTVLRNAFKRAFPTTTPGPFDPNDVKGVDINNPGEFIKYFTTMFKKLVGVDEDSIESLSLQQTSIMNLVGQFIAKGTTAFEILSQQIHAPLLFPDYLKKNDILCIYTKEGCMIVRFISISVSYYSTGGDIAHQENSEFFRLRKRTISYSLVPENGDGDSPDIATGIIDNFIDVYLLIRCLNTIQRKPAY